VGLSSQLSALWDELSSCCAPAAMWHVHCSSVCHMDDGLGRAGRAGRAAQAGGAAGQLSSGHGMTRLAKVPAAAPAVAVGAAVPRRRATSCGSAVVQCWCRVLGSGCGRSTRTGGRPACARKTALYAVTSVDYRAFRTGYVWPSMIQQLCQAVCCSVYTLRCARAGCNRAVHLAWRYQHRPRYQVVTQLPHSCLTSHWLIVAQQKHLVVCTGALLYDVRGLWVLELGNQGLAGSFQHLPVYFELRRMVYTQSAIWVVVIDRGR
jgi:hypothetical protein